MQLLSLVIIDLVAGFKNYPVINSPKVICLATVIIQKLKFMTRIDGLKIKLAVLKPHYLEITDHSHLHQGHYAGPGLTQTHLQIKIAAAIFSRMTRTMQHRIIHQLLADDFKQGMHALSIQILPEKLNDVNTIVT